MKKRVRRTSGAGDKPAVIPAPGADDDNDDVFPRARKPLVTGPGDLPALRHIPAPPTDDDIAASIETWKTHRDYPMRGDEA